MRKLVSNRAQLRGDISTLAADYSLTQQELKWFTHAYTGEVIAGRHYREKGIGEDHSGRSAMLVHYDPSEELLAEARVVLEWFASLGPQDRVQQVRNSTIFRRALGLAQQAERWRAWRERVEASEQSDRLVEPDPVNAPKVLDFGDGWEVFWLRTQEARDAEAAVMGDHVVPAPCGDPGNLFSLRFENRSFSTFAVRAEGRVAENNRGRGDEYKDARVHANRAWAILRVRTLLGGDLTEAVADGEHRLADGTVAHVRNGYLDHDSEPALRLPDGTREYHSAGFRHRQDGPAVIGSDGSKKWYLRGRPYSGAKLRQAIANGLFKEKEEAAELKP